MSRENRQVGEPFMYAYECVDDGRWQAYHTQLLRYDGAICPGLPLIPASDLEQVSRERDEAVRLLRPFAVYYEINDCDERDADDALEVPIGDLRLATAFLNNLDNRNE